MNDWTLPLDFPEALRRAVNGARITKASWGNTNSFGLFQRGRLQVHFAQEGEVYHDWIVTDADFGNDWLVLSEDEEGE